VSEDTEFFQALTRLMADKQKITLIGALEPTAAGDTAAHRRR
jgi:hypothetical protein